MKRLRWAGSLEAQKQYEEAVKKNPPQRKRKQKGKKIKEPFDALRKLPYASYLETNWWKARRRQKLRSTKGKCERCGGKAAQVHHKHYRSLGREKNVDLESICRECHEREHEGMIAANAHLTAIAKGKA